MSLDEIEKLYANHYPEIFRFCYRMIKNKQDAEELANETFVKAYFHFDSSLKTSFRTYIFKLAKNLCIDHRRSKRYKQTEITNSLTDDILIKPNNDLQQKEQLEMLEHCLDKLKEEERIAIRLNYIEGFVYKDIADIIGKSISTVKNRIEAGLKNLKTCLEKNGIIDS